MNVRRAGGAGAAFLGLCFLAGCSVNSRFVYQPNAALAAQPEVPLAVAVYPFDDGTPAWKSKDFMIPIGITVFHMRQNYAKTAIAPKEKEPFLPPERWAREFAGELSASGVFGSVQYAEGGKDPGGEFLVKGKVLECTMGTRWVGIEIIPFYLSAYYRFSAQFQLVRRGDQKVLWERTVTRFHKNMGMPDKIVPMLWRSMFGEAATDLVKTLRERRADWADLRAAAPLVPAASPASGGESVEDILKRIGSP